MKKYIVILGILLTTCQEIFSQKSHSSISLKEDFHCFYNQTCGRPIEGSRIILPHTNFVNDTVFNQLTDTLTLNSNLGCESNYDTTFYKFTINSLDSTASVSLHNFITNSTITENYVMRHNKWFSLNTKMLLPLNAEENHTRTENLYNQATRKFNNDSLEAALKDINFLISYQPSDYRNYFLRAVINEMNKNYANAIDDYSIYLSNYDDLQMYVSRGYCYYLLADYKNAIDDYNYVIRTDKSNFNAYKFRILARNALKDSLQTIADLDATLHLVKNVPDKLKELQTIAMDIVNFPKAIQIGRQLLTLNCTDSLVISNMLISYYKLDQMDSANYYYSLLCHKALDLCKIDSSLTFKVLSYDYYGIQINNDSLLHNNMAIKLIKQGGNIILENIWRSKKSKSFGKIKNLKLTAYNHIPETNPASKEYRFIWNYKNTYDSDKGNCLGKFELFLEPGKPKFKLTLFILNSYSPLIISGVLE